MTVYKLSKSVYGTPTPEKGREDTPAAPWDLQHNDIHNLSAQVAGRKLLKQTTFTPEEKGFLKDFLVEVFYRRYSHTFSKMIAILCHQDAAFARCALIEAARTGQQDLLKHTLIAAAKYNYINDMIVSSLIGNHLPTAQWLIEQSHQKFTVSQQDLKELTKKSQTQRQKIVAICLQWGDVSQIWNTIQSIRNTTQKLVLMGDWMVVKHRYIQEHREAPCALRVKRKI